MPDIQPPSRLESSAVAPRDSQIDGTDVLGAYDTFLVSAPTARYAAFKVEQKVASERGHFMPLLRSKSKHMRYLQCVSWLVVCVGVCCDGGGAAPGFSGREVWLRVSKDVKHVEQPESEGGHPAEVDILMAEYTCDRLTQCP